MVIRYFTSPPQWPMTSNFEGFLYQRSYPLHYFLILILEKEPVFLFSMLSAEQGNYWYHFYNGFGMKAVLDWGLNPGPPTLDASTLPLGYFSRVKIGQINVMDKIWDRKSFEVGGHWPLWRG